jgi:glycerol-3-phosphate acyltransferase PlsX
MEAARATTTIAVDAMGSDKGLPATCGGAGAVSLTEAGPSVVLIGDRDAVMRALEETPHDPKRLTVMHAPRYVPMDAKPKEALDEMPDASIAVAARLVKDGGADVLVSAGNTGAVTLACSRTFERLPGVRRTALGAVYPTERRRGEKDDPFSLILDAGLTVEATADDLVSFALMGSAYSRLISKNPRPRVALLSNGSEPTKGPAPVVEAHERLRARTDLDFIGNVEGMDIPKGTADVVVTSGFVGNIVLKMLEGVAETVMRLGRYAMDKKLRYKAGLALLAPAVKRLREVTDWEQYGGAPILGFDRLCIKAHGRSSSRAVANAIKVGSRATKSGLVEGIRQALA